MGQEVLVTVTSGGVLYNLSQVCDFAIEAIDGLQNAPVDRQATRFPGINGDTDRGHYVNPRFIMLTWANITNNNLNLWAVKRTINGIFRPRTNSPIVITFYFPDGFVASADVNLVGQLDNARLDGRTQRVVANLKASDPRLYNPEQKVVAFNLLNVDGGWDIAATGTSPVWADNVGWDINNTPGVYGSGWNIGVSVLNVTQVISYAQNVIFADIEYPVIVITGPLDNPVITNQTTNEKIDLTANGGLSLGVTDQVIINLTPTEKTITDQAGNSIDQYLTTDSDLATFHLAYNGELLPDGSFCDGNNTLLVQGSGATTATNVEVRYYERYTGVG